VVIGNEHSGVLGTRDDTTVDVFCLYSTIMKRLTQQSHTLPTWLRILQTPD
jgi:hypothetical protein